MHFRRKKHNVHPSPNFFSASSLTNISSYTFFYKQPHFSVQPQRVVYHFSDLSQCSPPTLTIYKILNNFNIFENNQKMYPNLSLGCLFLGCLFKKGCVNVSVRTQKCIFSEIKRRTDKWLYLRCFQIIIWYLWMIKISIYP